MIDFEALLAQPKYQPIPVLPLGDRLIISPIANKQIDLLKLAIDTSLQLERTASGLFIPPIKEDRVFAVVVAVGTDLDPEDTNKPQVGDVVYYNTYAAGDITMFNEETGKDEVHELNVIELFGNKYRYIKERDILARYKYGKDFSEPISMLANRVLVKPDESNTNEEGMAMIGNIIVPDAAVEIPTTGTVLALGTELRPVFDKVQIGTRILYHAYGGSEIIVHEYNTSKRYLALRESELMAIIED